MPEIAESVISREEEDFEENQKAQIVGISKKKYNSSQMVDYSDEYNQNSYKQPSSIHQSS